MNGKNEKQKDQEMIQKDVTLWTGTTFDAVTKSFVRLVIRSACSLWS